MGGKGGGVFKPVSSQFLVWAKEKEDESEHLLLPTLLL